MSVSASLLPESCAIDPALPEDRRTDFLAIPAKPAVYLLTGTTEAGSDHPVLLATVGDLRAALRRRLADNPPDTKTKRVAYGQICTRVHYRQVHSLLAANFYYAAAARALFPETAAALIPWRTSWWIGVERDVPGRGGAAFPRFRKTNNLADPGLAYAGPIRDKHAATRLVESLEDLFDLCRYHNILVQAPQGKACAYKEMGKCPAPCDGSESLASYRGRITAALAFLTDAPVADSAGDQGVTSARSAWREKLEAQMKTAAAALQFETAGKLKQRLSRAGLWWHGHPAHEHRRDADATAPLEHFAYLSLQPGKGKPWVEPWIIHFAGPTPIQSLPQFNLKELPAAAQHLADQCRFLTQCPAPACLTPEQTRHAALVAHHLFKGDSDHGTWLRLTTACDPAAIIDGVERLRAKKAKPLTEQASDVAASPAAEDAPEAPPDNLSIIRPA